METLEQIYNHLSLNNETIPQEILKHIQVIGTNCYSRKGVYTVLITLLYYKYLHPKQDIRYFQTHWKNGFSARSFDTHNVTPILKKLGLPAMAESGWLTRSLEQPYPYDFNYNGSIQAKLKTPFLTIIDYVQKNPQQALPCLKKLLSIVKNMVKKQSY